MSVPATPRVTKRLRFEILRRDNHTCRYCGQSAPDVKLTVDHVVPVALGGSNDPSNLVAACADCNSGKSATPADAAIVEDVAQDALRWTQAMASAAEAERRREADRAELHVELLNEWERHTKHRAGFNWLCAPFPMPGWDATFDQLLNAGLDLHDISKAMSVAGQAEHVHRDDLWRYFAGVAWRRLSERQETAQKMLSKGAV